MSFLAQSSKHSINIEELAFKRISQLITRFHSVLLPKAHDSGLFRDLSEEQEYLLANLDSEVDNSLHSILAGCLAIDSCLSNIFQSERNLTQNILKSLTLFLSAFVYAQPKQPQQTSNILIDGLIYLTEQVHQLPFSEGSPQYQKHVKILPHLKSDVEGNLIKSITIFSQKNEVDRTQNQENEKKSMTIKKRVSQQIDSSEELRYSPTFKIDQQVNNDEKDSQMHLKQRALLISQLFGQKKCLQMELEECKKKMESLENENQRLSKKLRIQSTGINSNRQQQSNNIFLLTQSKLRGQSKIKHRQQFVSDVPNDNLSAFNSKSVKSRTEVLESVEILQRIIKELREQKLVDEKEIKMLRDQINFYKRTNQVMKGQYEEQKNEYRRMIKKLYNQIDMISGYEGVDVYELLNQLEEQIDELKFQRREDRKILAQVQSRLMGLGTRRRNQYHPREYLQQFDQIDSRIARSRLINQSRTPQYLMQRSRSRSNNSRISHISRGRKKLRETIGSMMNYHPNQNNVVKKSNRPKYYEELSDFEDRKSQYSQISNRSPRYIYQNKKRGEKAAQNQYQNRKEQFSHRKYNQNGFDQQMANYQQNQPSHQNIMTAKFLRTSKTQKSLHRVNIPVLESIPYPQEQHNKQKMVYNDSFMVERSQQEYQNDNVTNSISNRFGQKQKDQNKEKNDTANFYDRKITKIVGFKEPNKKETQYKYMDMNVNSVSSSLHFDNPFQNVQQCFQKNDSKEEWEQKKGPVKWGKERVMMIPEVEPLVFKNLEKINENYLRNSGAKNQRVFVKPDRNY